ncbi:MAG TPA: WYL domain-containing protein, partial [Propionibacteriaceae bacterium]|nr:WYL domain-containing protein [Propionibacteriaceae bacterium]
AQALFLLAGPAASTAPAVKSALRKLVRALPSTFRADAEAAAEAVLIDSGRWGETGKEPPAVVRELQTAVVQRRKVWLSYGGRSGPPSQRVIEPWGLVDKDDVWYLIAGTPKGQRTFRVDRITKAVLTDEPAERPNDFQLARAWQEIVAEMEQRRSLVQATVLIEDRFVHVLQSHYGRHCEVLGAWDDGRVRVRVASHMARSVAEQLAGWGKAVEVLEPQEVRDELARIGTELVRSYAG